ncbi:MAG TPA: amidohydrolase family protein [Streptosporangiaceae bacterium]|nr:amidohydrolase family protein [Streptosporangiaceae bacterium]
MRKIDAFAHILPPSYARRLEAIVSAPGVSDRILGFQPWIHEDPALTDLDARWRAIDPFGDYVQVLTLAVPPIDQLGPPAVARDLARAANDELAGLVARYPDRFAGFAAALPMSDPEAAAAELARAMGELGALGAQLHTNVGGVPLDEPRFEPVFAAVTSLGGALWIHPTRSEAWPDYPAEQRSRYGIWWALGWPYETSVCMARLVYSGCFDRHPGLRVITHHAGAMVPHFAGRLASPLEDPDRARILSGLRAAPMDYFRRFYADTALFGNPHAVRCAVEFFGPGHVLFGTDMPLGGPTVVGDTIADIEALGLAGADTAAIFAGNARAVLKLPG